MGRTLLRSLVTVGFVLVLSCATWAAVAAARSAKKRPFRLVHDATLVHPGYRSKTAVRLSSLSATDNGYVKFRIPRKLTVSQLHRLSTEYELTLGSCWGGSPRFDVGIDDPTAGKVELHFYIGPPPAYTGCAMGAWTNSGNLATPTSPVDDSALPDGSSAVPYQSVQSSYGSDPVTAVELVVDGGWSAFQTGRFDDTRVNGKRFTYERR